MSAPRTLAGFVNMAGEDCVEPRPDKKPKPWYYPDRRGVGRPEPPQPSRPPRGAFEAGLAEPQGGLSGHPLHHYTCRCGCGRKVRHLGHDGYADYCVGLEEQEDQARLREGRRRLHRDTAMLLRRLGFAERAAWHDAEADR